MSFRRIRRAIKNALGRLPAPLQDRISAGLLRGYEWYLATRKSLTEGKLTDNGLPVPPPKLRVAVVGHADVKAFLEDGHRENEIIREALDRNGIEIQACKNILDWGCGCGRILRWWDDLGDTGVFGCDYNPKLVEWVDQNLPFATGRPNRLEPPLPLDAGQFDFVYAISIFTHLTDELSVAWMREIHRVLEPGGSFFFTTHGYSFEDRLSPDEKKEFDDGNSVVQFASVEGSNLCAAYHPVDWIKTNLLEGFELLEVRESHTLSERERIELGQDRWLIRKVS